MENLNNTSSGSIPVGCTGRDENLTGSLDAVKENRHIYLKKLDEIDSEDLTNLKDAVEGWFLEYKERVLEPAKLAKSISSFANSHGGLLILGIKENQKTRKLESFVPMDMPSAENCVTQIRNAAVAHLVPTPFFDTKIVEVPGVELANDKRWIVLASVPRGANAPYLHSSGCIYTRVGDSASPIQLTDIGVIERLWAQKREMRESLKSRIDFLSAQTKKRNPCVTIVVSIEDDINPFQSKVSFKDFQTCASNPTHPGSPSIFDNIYSLDSSYVARRTEGSVEGSALLWDYDYRRKLHFIQIPIATHQWTGASFENSSQTSSWNLSDLDNYLYANYRNSSLIIINLLPTLYFTSIILHKIQEFHTHENKLPKLKLNIRAFNVMKTVAYIGTPHYMCHIKQWGVPFIYRDVDFVLPLEEFDSWHQIEPKETAQTNQSSPAQDYVNSFPIFMLLARSLGIPFSVIAIPKENDADDVDLTSLIDLFSKISSNSFSFSSMDNPAV